MNDLTRDRTRDKVACSHAPHVATPGVPRPGPVARRVSRGDVAGMRRASSILTRAGSTLARENRGQRSGGVRGVVSQNRKAQVLQAVR